MIGMKEIVKIFGPILAGWLWIGLISPLISRFFYIPAQVGIVPILRNRELTRPQFIFAIGVLGYGVGMFITWTGWYVLRPALFFVYSPSPTFLRLLESLLMWLSGGVFVGLVCAPRRPKVIE